MGEEEEEEEEKHRSEWYMYLCMGGSSPVPSRDVPGLQNSHCHFPHWCIISKCNFQMTTFGYQMTLLVTKCTLQVSHIKQLFLWQHNNTLHSTVKPALGLSGEEVCFPCTDTARFKQYLRSEMPDAVWK